MFEIFLEESFEDYSFNSLIDDLLSNWSKYHRRLDHDLEQYDQPMKQNEFDVLERDLSHKLDTSN